MPAPDLPHPAPHPIPPDETRCTAGHHITERSVRDLRHMTHRNSQRATLCAFVACGFVVRRPNRWVGGYPTPPPPPTPLVWGGGLFWFLDFRKIWVSPPSPLAKQTRPPAPLPAPPVQHGVVPGAHAPDELWFLSYARPFIHRTNAIPDNDLRGIWQFGICHVFGIGRWL